jgi:hypothetical protein
MLRRVGAVAAVALVCGLAHWWWGLLGVGAVAVATWLFRLWRWPKGPCWGCRGRSGRSAGSDAEQWGDCARCEDNPAGRGARVRVGATLFHPELRKEK